MGERRTSGLALIGLVCAVASTGAGCRINSSSPADGPPPFPGVIESSMTFVLRSAPATPIVPVTFYTTNTLKWECACVETGIEGSSDLRVWSRDAVLSGWLYIPPTSSYQSNGQMYFVGGSFTQQTNHTATVITTNSNFRFWRAFSR